MVKEGGTYLEVDDDEDNDNRGDQVADIGRVLTVEGLLKSKDLVGLGEEEVEESDDGAFELDTVLGLDRDGRERLPQDGLADVGGDEEGDAASETVALLEELVKEDDNDSGEGELEDDEASVDGSDFVDVTVHA